MVVAGIHVDEAQVVAAGVVLPVPGEAAVGHAGVRACGRAAEGSERLVHGVAAVDPRAAGVAHVDHATQVVGVQRVERRRPAADLLPGHGDLAVGAEGYALGNSGVRAAGNLLLVVGEGRVDVRAVGVERARAGAGGVVLGCLGAGWLLARRWRRGVSKEGWQHVSEI